MRRRVEVGFVERARARVACRSEGRASGGAVPDRVLAVGPQPVMRKLTTAALVAAVTASTWTIPSVVQGADLSAMVGTWSARLSGGIRGTLRVLPVRDGRLSGFMCVEFADGSTLVWGFSPEDEPGTIARVKFGVLEVQRPRRTYVFEIPKAGQQRIRHRARRQGEPGAFVKTLLRRTNSVTCADRLISRADVHLEPVAKRDDNPLVGEWTGVRGNGVIDQIRITAIGSWGRTRGVFCELLSKGTAFRFWDLDDPRIRAQRRRSGDKLIVTWKRSPAKWALRHEKKYRFEWVRSGNPGQNSVLQSWRYGAKKREEVTMTPGNPAGGCLARIRPSGDSRWAARIPVQTDDAHRGR